MSARSFSVSAVVLRGLIYIVLALLVTSGATAVRAQEGTRQWRSYVTAPVYSSPSLATDGTLYVGVEATSAAKAYALSAAGAVRWDFRLPTDWVDTAPAVADDGTIYVGSWDGRLYALNPTGSIRLRWSYTAGGFIASSPAIGADGTIYFGSGDSSFYALNPNGTLKWNFPVGDWIDSSPAIGPDGTIYFGCWDNNVYALNPDGTLRWQFTTGNNVISSPAIGADGTVYIGSTDHKLYALSGATGAKLWEYETGGEIGASPTVGAGPVVYVGSGDGNFYAINGTTGALQWQRSMGLDIYSSAALRADGVLIFGAGFNVHALNADGSPRWSLATDDYVDSSPVIGPDGTIYIGSLDRYLYAINGNGQGPASDAPWPMFRRDAQRQGRAPAGVLTTPVTLTFGNLSAVYDGTPKPITVTTAPDGVAVALTYDGSPEAPSAAGTYTVSATVTDANYTGSATDTLVIAPATQTISFTQASQPFGFAPLTLVASASSGLPVAFTLVEGPAQLEGATLTFTGAGTVTVRATQAGDANHTAAAPVETTFAALANFASWTAQHFTVEERAAGLAAADGVLTSDGLANLLKYALGLAPKTAFAGVLLDVRITDQEWICAFSRPSGLAEVSYAIESSTDLVNWQAQAIAASTSLTLPGWEDCEARVSAPAEGRLFFRLRVTR